LAGMWHVIEECADVSVNHDWRSVFLFFGTGRLRVRFRVG